MDVRVRAVLRVGAAVQSGGDHPRVDAIPTYGSLIAAINLKFSETTRIGKDVLNHSFMIPGVVATAGAVVTGPLLAKVMF